MYQLYIGNKNYSSWSLRPWVLMTELAIAFEEHLVPFDPGSSWAKFRAFSPTGRVPCLVDGDTVVWDSLAITEYLAERHPAVWPRDTRARAWARCAAAEMHSGFSALRNACSMNCGLSVRMHEISAALQRDIDRLDELWSEGLQRFGGPFLVGESFTAADAFFAPVAFRVHTYGLGLGQLAAAYAQRLLSLPSMQDWKRAALLEPWREADHEAEAAACGTILEDLRIAPGR
jgi:glutathione S-transferase